MNDILSSYESVAATTGEMLEAARRQDWDALVLAEKRCAGMIARLKASGAPDNLDPGARRLKSELILRILAHDAEIRRLVDPRLRELEQLLAGSATRRRVNDAYGA